MEEGGVLCRATDVQCTLSSGGPWGGQLTSALCQQEVLSGGAADVGLYWWGKNC